jgi:hypothetical protein
MVFNDGEIKTPLDGSGTFPGTEVLRLARFVSLAVLSTPLPQDVDLVILGKCVLTAP